MVLFQSCFSYSGISASFPCGVWLLAEHLRVIFICRPDHPQLQRLDLTGLMGKSCPLHTRLVHSQCIAALKEWQSRMGWLCCHISTFLSQAPPLRGLYQGLPQRSSSGWWWWRGPEDTFLHSDTALSTLHSHFSPLSLLLAHNTEPFVWGSQSIQTIPHICADPPALQLELFHEENGRGGWHFSSLAA